MAKIIVRVIVVINMQRCPLLRIRTFVDDFALRMEGTVKLLRAHFPRGVGQFVGQMVAAGLPISCQTFGKIWRQDISCAWPGLF